MMTEGGLNPHSQMTTAGGAQHSPLCSKADAPVSARWAKEKARNKRLKKLPY